MKLSAYCMNCLVKRQMENIKSHEDEELKSNYMSKVLSIISKAEESDTAPVIASKISKLHMEYFGEAYSFEDLKYRYNMMMLKKEAAIKDKIRASKDRLLEAIKYARVGNYIDFGAMGSIEDDKLNALLDTVKEEYIDEGCYRTFKEDLGKACKLVYLTDNCGEVVLDKLLINCIKEAYQNIHITVIVRGGSILNDATIEDAGTVGLTAITEVIGNGTDIAGNSLEHIDKKAREHIETADIIISKGQGNFETLNGCGLNVYYLFLCKCEWFVKRFSLEQYKGVFINDRNLPDNFCRG